MKGRLSAASHRIVAAALTLSSRQFNQDASGAKKTAQGGPVFITDRGRQAHVLPTIEEYRKLSGGPASIIDLLCNTDAADIEFKAPLATIQAKAAGLS